MKKMFIVVISILVVLALGLWIATDYMIKFSLSPDPNRTDIDSAYNKVLYSRFPDMRPWVDQMTAKQLLRDTFVVMPHSGERHHALYIPSDRSEGRTAIIVHGYKDCAIKFLYMGRMYYEKFGYNVLMPDLSAHGLSDGESIGMGWKDSDDLLYWTKVAEKLFCESGNQCRIVVHGVSMGAATTMNLSGKSALPSSIRGFVEDCGFTSVWNEFKEELKRSFSLPAFPLLYTGSALCQARYGWSFKEASPLESVKSCNLPMLFIHGDADTFVPFWMVHPLYESKPFPKYLWIAKGSEHALAYKDHPVEYTHEVRKFLNEIMK